MRQITTQFCRCEPSCRPVWHFHSEVEEVAVRERIGEIRAVSGECCSCTESVGSRRCYR